MVSDELKRKILDGIKDEKDGINYWQGLNSLLKSDLPDMSMGYWWDDVVWGQGVEDEEKHLDALKGLAATLGISTEGGNTAEGSLPSWATRLGL